MATVTLSLNKALIYEAVKADTYLTGQAEKTIDGANNARAYSEQAGDDNYHNRKLERTLYGAVGRFEVELADFIDTSASGNISHNFPAQDDTFTISFVTSSRFNTGLVSPMSQLAQEFIINTMISMWWLAMKPDLANQYKVQAQDSLFQVRKCLTKTAPAASSSDYASVTGTTS